MNPIKSILGFLLIIPACFGQLTTDQKVADFMQLSGLYAKHYAPYEWKRDALGFDLLNVKPWLDQVKNSKDDIEFYDICVRYVAALQDSHDEFTLYSDFYAWLHMDVDIYDGKVLIIGLDRAWLPLSKFPIYLGDEIVSVDGIPVATLIESNIPYAVNGSGNVSARRRLAADAITFRYQAWNPKAHLVGATATVAIRDEFGDVTSYEIQWDKVGTPITGVGPVPSPRMLRNPVDTAKTVMNRRKEVAEEMERMTRSRADDWGVWTDHLAKPEPVALLPHEQMLKELQTMEVAEGPRQANAGDFGRFAPVFGVPTGFVLRLGSRSTDQFVSGTFPAGNYKVGFIRIPTMSPTNGTTALQQFQSEIAYFNANTDGLVIDVMENGGGSLCYTESLLRFLIPYPFRSVAYEIRATQYWVYAFSSTMNSAKSAGAAQWEVDLWGAYLKQVQQAMSENRGRTGSLPICQAYFEGMTPYTDANGNNLAYTKPILVLQDEFTISAGEAFGALLQDAGRATFYGTRTDGGGGNPASYTATTYSEGSTRVTRTFVTRASLVQTPDYPAANHMENLGVYPDIWTDIMTEDNLYSSGRPFVLGFTLAISDLIRASKQ